MVARALVVGSLAYDVIFSIHGDIRDEILVKKGKVGDVSMMFTANGKQKYYGGTAGNIAYGLSLLDESPSLFSIVGKDFKDEYQAHLESKNIDLKVITRKDSFMATFYGISDEKYQQIGIWQPDAYGEYVEQSSLTETLSDDDFKHLEIAIFSPGTGISTLNHMIEFRKHAGNKPKVIFDPSQVLTIFYDKNRLRECLTHANVLIGNETEIEQFKTAFKLSASEIFDLGVNSIIETLGKDGVILHTPNDNIKIPPVKPRKVIETTGAGDAFRSGFLYGQLNNYSEIDSCRIGTFMGARSVEELSGQMYSVEKKEFNNFTKTLKK